MSEPISPPAARLDGRRVALATASATLHTAALPPWDATALAWIAIAPLLLALRGLSPARGALLGFLWGSLAIWGIGWWVPRAMAGYYDQPFWFGVLFALMAGFLVLGVYAAGYCACACRIQRLTPAAARPLALAALWVAWELARSWPWTSNPWLLLGYSLAPSPTLVQAADLGGVYVLSFLVVVVNAAVVEVVSAFSEDSDRVDVTSSRRALVAVLSSLIIVACAFAYGQMRLRSGVPAGPATDIAVVQANVDLGSQWSEALYGEGLDRYLDLSRTVLEEHPVQLLVWPESAITAFLADEPAFRRAIAHELRGAGADLITGGPFAELETDSVKPGRRANVDARYRNSAFYVTPDGTIRGRYDKLRLLPFGEYFPLPGFAALQRRFERVRSFEPGEPPMPIDTRFGKIAVVICFEAIFPDLVREQMRQGARLLVNLSNDAWLGAGPGPAQHFAMARLRAIENRIWLVRATTTGISAIVDPLGRVHAQADYGREGTPNTQVGLVQAASPYVRFGDAFGWTCVAISALALVLPLARRS
jgi:apolipoprotein N-acyltransferase